MKLSLIAFLCIVQFALGFTIVFATIAITAAPLTFAALFSPINLICYGSFLMQLAATLYGLALLSRLEQGFKTLIP